MLESAVGSAEAPALTLLAENGRYGRAVSVFPSLTPVCVSSIVTGAYPDAHHIPHLVWYHREQRRLVEYGSSFGAIRRAGTRRSIVDAIFNMTGEHLAPEAPTVFERLEDAGLVTAAVNIPCYRGRTRHKTTIPGLTRSTLGPTRFFFYSLFESDATGAPLAVRNRSAGTIDDYAAAVGRWLVTRDGFDFFAYYLSDYDYLSHAHGPDSPREGIVRVDRALSALVEAAGGPDEFLGRYAVLLCSDHGQTHVRHGATLQMRFRDVDGVVVTASNRAGMVYRLQGCRLDVPELAGLLDEEPSADLVAYLDGEDVVVRRRGEEVKSTNGALIGYPDAATRLAAALRNPNAGDVLVSAAPGYEFARPGRAASRGRRKPRLARCRRFRGAGFAGRGRGRAAEHRRLRGAPCLALRCLSTSSSGAAWSSCSCARATSWTSASWPRWSASRASSSCRRRSGHAPYQDAALPIGAGQTISQPYMVARICEVLALGGTERVLDVGTGSGYQAAVLAELAGEVVTIERIPELVAEAERALEEAGYENVEVRLGDGTLGVPDRAPFRAIAVAAAAPDVPESALRAARAGGPDGDPRRTAAVAGPPARRAQPRGAGRHPISPVPLRPPARRGGIRLKRARVRVHGGVQGVGFRYEARSRAQSLGLAGWVRNLPDGSVEATFEGEDERVESMVEWSRCGPRGARVDGVDVSWEQPTGGGGFAVR